MANILDTREIPMEESDVSSNKVYGILSYIGILFIIPLLAAKDSPFAKFHANQGLVAFLTELILNVISGVLGTIFNAINLGWLSTLVGTIISLVSLAIMIIGIIYVAQGKAKELPLIGQLHLIDSENKQN